MDNAVGNEDMMTSTRISVEESASNQEPSSVNDSAEQPNGDMKHLKKYESWYSVDIFLFFLASFQLINLLTLTYTDSVLNFIAERFRIPYTMASFIPSSYQVGSMVAIVPVSYFGAKWHRPRAISVGVIIMILGLGFCILPHFIMPSEEKTMGAYHKTLCRRNNPYIHELKKYLDDMTIGQNITISPLKFNLTKFEKIRPIHARSVDTVEDEDSETSKNWFTSMIDSLEAHYLSSNKVINPSLTTPLELPCNENATVYNPSILIIIGHAFIGIGSSPLWPLGVAYLDDHLVSRKVPLYLGIFIGTTLTGPVAGFLLGSLSSAIYVSIDAHDLTPTDPEWIGAWWLGYVIAGILLVILLLPFYFFPDTLEVTDEKRKEREDYEAQLEASLIAEAEAAMTNSSEDLIADCNPGETIPLLCSEETNSKRIWREIKGLFYATRRLLSIPIVFCSFTAYVILANLLAGVSTFGSTYIEKQFNVLRITSDMLIGGVCVPLGIAGTFGGGFIMKRYNFNVNQSIWFNVVMSSIGTAFFSVLFGLGCEIPLIAGIDHPYSDGAAINVTSECNRECNCPQGSFNLVCSASNITYLSPCYAGCETNIDNPKHTNAKEKYTDCSCIDVASGPLTAGSCSTPGCTRMIAGTMIAAAFGIMILCLCQAPTYTILLRVLRVDDKPLAIGLLTFLSRILGFIPAPIWFAMVIDKSCIYWGPKCNGKAVCKLYNNRGLRLNFVGACAACSVGYSLTFAATVLWFMFSESRGKKPLMGEETEDDSFVLKESQQPQSRDNN